MYCSVFYNKLWNISHSYLQVNTKWKHEGLFKLWTQRKGERSNIKSQDVQNSVIGMYRYFVVKNLDTTLHLFYVLSYDPFESSYQERSSCIYEYSVGNAVLLTTTYFVVAKFTTLTPLSLLSSCKLSFPIVGLKVSSLPNFAVKFPNRIFMWYWGKWSNTCSNSYTICPLGHHFYRQLAHARSVH
jgi:hypothetical protein